MRFVFLVFTLPPFLFIMFRSQEVLVVIVLRRFILEKRDDEIFSEINTYCTENDVVRSLKALSVSLSFHLGEKKFDCGKT